MCLCTFGQLPQRICSTLATKLVSSLAMSGKSAFITAFPPKFIITAWQTYPHSCRGLGTTYMRALILFECKADICVMQIEDTQPARQPSGDAVPSVFPPTFSGGVGQARSGHLPIPEPYRDSQSIGPLAAKRRSQSLLKNERSGAVFVVHLQTACLWYNPSCDGHVIRTRVYLQLLILFSISCQKSHS